MNLHPKVQAALGATPVVIVLVWVVGLFGEDMPPEVAAAFGALLAAAFGYFKPLVSKS